MKKEFIFGIVGLLTIASFYFGYQIGKEDENSQLNNKNSATDVSNYVKEQDADTTPTDLYSSIKEKDFTQFAETTIEKRCPFYKPDGITYRECLSDWEQGLESKLLTEQVDEVHAYCSTFTKKYVDETSMEGTELFLKCSIFKLQ
ncbi:TPA: hypothetical protein DEP94_00665 [Candidatus Nomurabacteria bacterium]|nr:hypothetical protein [Candidatus Nomurabacteria bacterium]